MRALQLDRQEFLDHYWHYKPGQHVACFGPTQRAGKTHLMFQLLGASLRPDLSVTAFCMKPRDVTVGRWSRAFGFREVPTWPPPPKWPWQDKPPGYTLWPRHTMDPDVDNPHIRAEFRKGILDGYKRGNCIEFIDEISGICGELDLTTELQTVLTKGGGGKCGAWIASQKPSGTQQSPLPGYVFNCPYHFFLAPDNEKRNRKRYADLAGGIDTDFIEWQTLRLQRYHFLYINADGEMAVIGP